MSKGSVKPEYCCYPDCFHCPYDDCHYSRLEYEDRTRDFDGINEEIEKNDSL